MSNSTQEKLNIPAWISIEEASKLLNVKVKTVKNRCYKGDFNYKIEVKNKVKQIFVRYSSLPIKFNIDLDQEDSKYSEAPEWSRLQADKYINVVQKSLELRGEKLEKYIENWNQEHPDNQTSYSSIIKMRRRYRSEGLSGLLSRFGNNSGRTVVDDFYFEYFKNLYLVEGAPSLQTCWDLTLGYAIKNNGVDKFEFPSCSSFKRRLRREVPKQSIHLARYGQTAWNRRYGNYIERDYSNVVCGKVWVSDHAQIDIACLSPDGNVVFPWVTAWRDYKSGKWLGWLLQCGNPNSDHIFQTFYYAAD